MERGLEGSVAIVTGAAGGIGSAVVRQLREAGASVVAEDIAPGVNDLGDDAVAPLQGDAAGNAGTPKRVAFETEPR